MHFIAPLISNPWTVWGVVVGLVVWAVVSGLHLANGTRRLANALTEGRRRLAETADSLRFASQYESISDDLGALRLIGPRWQEYRQALLIPAGPGRPVRAATRSETWFNGDDLLRSAGIDGRYHAALPNLLVGAGLLFTFLGLATALGSAGGIVAEGATQQQRNADLKLLLDTASFKFITSLFGLGLSIAYALFRKNCLRSVDGALDGFISALDARVPLITPAALQQEANTLLERQGTQLETFSTELAVNIAGAFDKAFDQRLGEHIAPLTEAMQRLASGMSSRNEEAMQTMLDGFLQRLQGGAGDRMTEVAESLAGLGNRLEGLQSGLGDAAVRMSQSADAMATRMGEGAEAALARITDQMGGVVESLRGVADQTRAAGASAGAELSTKIEAAAGSFEAAARQVSEMLGTAAADMQRRMDAEAAASSTRMTAQFEAMLGELRALAEASRSSGAKAFEVLAERISNAASGFETTAAQVARSLEQAGEASGGALGRGAEEAVKRIADATEGMRTELQTMVAQLRQAMGSAGEQVRVSAVAGGEALRGSLDGAGSALADAVAAASTSLRTSGVEAGAAVRQGGEAAGARMETAGGALAGRAEGLGVQARQIDEAVTRLSTRIAELERATGAAAAPLAGAAGDLRTAGEAARATLEPLRAVSESLRGGLEQVAGAAQKLEATQASAGRLMDALNQATGRFEGVDRELGRTLDELQKGLKGFTDQVRAFVIQTDTNLAKGTQSLGASVKQLEDTLTDFLDQMRKR